MSETNTIHFSIVTGNTVKQVIQADFHKVVSVIENAYRAHQKQESENPSSHFLRFKNRPNARIIALPASLGDGFNVSGIKWIASYPDNIKQNIPRASAVLILNRCDNGYPYACMEASLISAARTAASAVLGAYWMNGRSRKIKNIGFLGTGFINRTILEFLIGTGWDIEQINLFDQVPEYMNLFADHTKNAINQMPTICDSAEKLIKSSDMISIATTAATPHIHDVHYFSHNPIVLHVSLRDLSHDIILQSNNVVDDIDHCLTANTSPHLAEMNCGHRDFITGTIGDLLSDTVTLTRERPLIFSPFGMGILDIALGKYIYDQAQSNGDMIEIDHFFSEQNRY